MNKKQSTLKQQLKEFFLDKISTSLPKKLKFVKVSITIIFFWSVEKVEIATLSLNSRNITFEHNGTKHFVDKKQLRVQDCPKLTREKFESVFQSLLSFFTLNPYKNWFKPMNKIFQSKGYKYYNNKIVHLDISAWTKYDKSNSLSREKRETMIDTTII